MKGVYCYFFVLVLGCLVSMLTAKHREESYSLRTTQTSHSRIKGRYLSSQGEKGIHFDSIATNNYHSLSISTTQGKGVIVFVQHNRKSPMRISVFDDHFILTKDPKNSNGHLEYSVPRGLQKYMTIALRHPQVMSVLENRFDSASANLTRMAAILQLLQSNEAKLIVEAAKALGNRGIIGRDNPAAMTLYILALQLEKQRTRLGYQAVYSATNQEESYTEKKRRYCQSSKSTCSKDKCPVDGKDCVGLCGNKCTCWRIVCGDCCNQTMCHDHDHCCDKYGYFSWSCLGIIRRLPAIVFRHLPDFLRGSDPCKRAYSCHLYE